MSSVKERILNDAEEASMQLREEYNRRAEALRLDFGKAEAEKAGEYEKKLESVYESEMRRLLSISRLEIRREILSAKRDILRELAGSVKERIRTRPELYMKFIERGIVKGVVTGSEEIIVSPGDREIFSEEFMNRLNILAGEVTGSTGNLRLGEELCDTGGGVLLREGRITFNATVEKTVERIMEEYEPELAAILFGGGDA